MSGGFLLFFSSSSWKTKGSIWKQDLCTPLCHLGEICCQHSFSGLPKAEKKAGSAKTAIESKTHTQNSVICLYILGDFPYHEVILAFEYIIRYDSLFMVACLWYNAILYT